MNPLTLCAAALVSFAPLQLVAQESGPKRPIGVPSDAVHHQGRWFSVFLEKASWRTVRDRCAVKGGRLAVIPDAATKQFIRDLADKRPLWLGATDEKTESLWIWTDGSQMKFKAWGPHQPNGRGENCLAILNDGAWHDVREDSRGIVGYICEWAK